MTQAPARLLKGDDEVGYWEYEADVNDGRWVVEFTRGEAWTPGPEDDPGDSGLDYQRYHLGVTMRLGTELVFTTNNYEPGVPPFLSSYEMNGMMAMACVANLAQWYRGSAVVVQLGEVYEAIKAIAALGPEDIAIGFADQTGEPINTAYYHYLTIEDVERLHGHARSTSDLCQAFYLLGMEETTPEWRREVCGVEEFEPPTWYDPREGCDHEH